MAELIKTSLDRIHHYLVDVGYGNSEIRISRENGWWQVRAVKLTLGVIVTSTYYLGQGRTIEDAIIDCPQSDH